MKKAVEWLQSQIVFESVDKELLARWDEDSDLSEYFKQALQMEKEQMKKFYGKLQVDENNLIMDFENYYNQTFNQQEQ